MRRYVIKPDDLKVLNFIGRIQQINTYLSKFPTEQNEGITAPLSEDKPKDILFHGLPSSWKDEMTLQDFRYYNHEVMDLVGFCERIELLEGQKIPRRNVQSPLKVLVRKGRQTSKTTIRVLKAPRNGACTTASVNMILIPVAM